MITLEKMSAYSLCAGFFLLVLALSGCGSLSKVSDQGATDHPVWPDAKSVTFNTGSYPNLDNLRQVSPGMAKDQIYGLLGRPHFNEGLLGVHEWDYLFHFRTAAGEQTCQYKVLFDNTMRAQNFYWHPESCAQILNGLPAPAVGKTFALNSDVLFAFGSATLTPAGQAEVGRVAATLSQQDAAAIVVAGYTDRIGSAAANQSLSQRRAEAVRNRLVQQGIAGDHIHAQGMGESPSVTQCGTLPKAELVACLAPDRRVLITATGKH
jgi:outer membrane protein OmpA-like peptidoglycan-associated protein